jgi:hypothetical protein
MRLALGTAAIVLVVLVWELLRPRVLAAIARVRAERASAARRAEVLAFDPGRERRAEQRARALLRSCIDEEAWAMYRDLGFVRVWGALGERAGDGEAPAPPQRALASADASAQAPYAYLVYPHRPIVAYIPQTGALLSEYCVAFPDHSKPFGSARLPDSDDVLAKWMALSANERGLIAQANMHLPGRQIDPAVVHRDLQRLARWERARTASAGIVRGA